MKSDGGVSSSLHIGRRLPIARTVDRCLAAGAAALVLLPLLVVLPGFREGQLVFVLYREPKLATLTVLGWWWLVLAVWWRRRDLPTAAVLEVARSPIFLATAGFTALSVASLLWVEVTQNGLYEVRQWLLLLPLLLVLAGWMRGVPGTGRVVTGALVAGGAILTAVGLLQAAGALPWLVPINPYDEVAHPSLMGYKNPAALMVLGQIFLAVTVVTRRGAGGLGWRLAGAVLVLTELVYLLSLQSRTSIAAFAVGVLTATVLGVVVAPTARYRWATAGVAVTALAVAVVVTVAIPAVRGKVASVAGLLAEPGRYLETDRGIYLRNTVHMATHRPLGVGSGDWQTQYPVYRRWGRDVAFDLDVQVRRAHSDPVQTLGELGWAGLLLWSIFTVSLVGTACRTAIRTRKAEAVLLAAQVTAMAAAMLVDYVLEIPSHRLLVTILAALVLAGAGDGRDRPRTTLRLPAWVAIVLALAALANTVSAAQLVRKIQLEGHLLRGYLVSSPSHSGAPPELDATLDPASPEALRLMTLSLEMARTPGHTKTMFRCYLVAAHVWHMVGADAQSRAFLDHALELHPYHPNSMLLAAVLASDAGQRGAWRGAAEHLIDEATEGFARPYPRPLVH